MNNYFLIPLDQSKKEYIKFCNENKKTKTGQIVEGYFK